MQRELEEELRLHIELRTHENRHSGMSADEAAFAARRRFGNVALLKEDGRHAWGWLRVERLTQDLRYGVRQLRRHPSATAATILTLALGIGANTSMFTLVNATLIAPPSADQPDRLVWLAEQRLPSGRLTGNSSYPTYLHFRDRRELFDGVLAFSGTDVSLGDGAPERVGALIVSGNYFEVLGIRAQAGRVFTRTDDGAPGAQPVAVIGDALWRRRYAADPTVIGQPITLNGQPVVVVGVAPPDFGGIEMDERQPAVWVPMAMAEHAMPGLGGELLSQPHARWLRVVARLATGVTRRQADAALRTIEWQRHTPTPERPAETTMAALPVAGGLDPSNRSEAGPILALGMIVPGLVLLVACANAGNLLLARGVDRQRELALRRALGASRARVARQLVTESLLLALGAGAVALLLSSGLTRLIGWLAGVPPAILDALQMDWRVVVATVVAALAAGLVFSVLPSLAVSDPPILAALKDGGAAGATLGARRRRLRNVFVVSQVAVSLVLLVVAGLFLRSLSKALLVDPGFDTTRTLTVSFDLGLQGYDAPARAAFTRTLLDRTRALPGVHSAAVTTMLPLGGRMFGTEIETDAAGTAAGPTSTGFAQVTAEYFAVLGTPMVRGRSFSAEDVDGRARVIIVNETLARRLWGTAEPLGQRTRFGAAEPWYEVVGVVRDSKYHELTEAPRPFCLVPLDHARPSMLSLIVRAQGDPQPVLAAVVPVARGLDRNLPVVNARALDTLAASVTDKQRAGASLLGVFGALALTLAAVGLYGITAHAASLRVREIGIRLALGARAGQVQGLFVRDGLRLSIYGIVIGLILSLGAARLIASLLFGLGAADVVAFLGAAGILCLTALVASYLPARRVTRVDPLLSLRRE
jgi:predicted permease